MLLGAQKHLLVSFLLWHRSVETLGNGSAFYQDSTGGWPLLTINSGMLGDVFSLKVSKIHCYFRFWKQANGISPELWPGWCILCIARAVTANIFPLHPSSICFLSLTFLLKAQLALSFILLLSALFLSCFLPFISVCLLRKWQTRNSWVVMCIRNKASWCMCHGSVDGVLHSASEKLLSATHLFFFIFFLQCWTRYFILI